MSTRVANGARALALALVLAGCGSTPVLSFQTTPSPYDRMSSEELQRVADARARARAGDAKTARRILGALAAGRPENIPVGVLLQELELERIEALPAAQRDEQERALRERYLVRAEQEGGAADLVLAARLEPDRLAAKRLLERALERDGRCAWALYGQAHALVRNGEFDAAREMLARARAADPAHMPSRRLEANLLARGGETAAAIRALRLWLADAEADPRVDARELVSARVDLALLYALAGRNREVERTLAELGDASPSERARAELVAASALTASRKPELAIEAADAAARADPTNPLPRVQLALLYQRWLDEPELARDAWRRVLELLEGVGSAAGGRAREDDLAWLQLGIQARVQLERLERDLASGPKR